MIHNWAAPVEIIASGLSFPEGPIALADGSVLVVEIEGQTLARITKDGAIDRLATLQGGPNGAALGPDGYVYIANSGGWLFCDEVASDGRTFRRTRGQSAQNGWIERVDPIGGGADRIYVNCNGVPLNAPNDLVFDAHGYFYFTDHGKRRASELTLGAVYRAAPDGNRIVRIVDGLITPNGIGLSPDGSTLYVAETLPRRLWAFDLDGPETIRRHNWPSTNGGRLLASLPDYNGLDSLAVDADGWIHVASLVNGGFWSVAPDGSNRSHFDIDDPYTTNVCFGGPDLKQLFVTMSGSGCLGRIARPVAGLPLHFANADRTGHFRKG